ncbi:MAG: hypothetical protein JWN53_377 [Gemmatimonadetes bacterium]|nr:hypothetical protein [Gemmatimonadota bacterium]
MAELSRGDAAAEPGIAARLERIESAVETVALEVERIGESQRFLTRVMGDRALAPGDASHPA